MGIVKKVSSKLDTEEYIQKMENDEKRNLYIRVKNVVKDAKVKKYVADREEIYKEGVSVFGFFTGKNNLQFEKLKNIKLKIELLETEKIPEKAKYEACDILSELYSCAISELGGVLTKDMQDMYDFVKTKYCDEDISDEKIYKMASEKLSNGQSYLPMIHKERPFAIFGDTKVQIDFYRIENQKLENQILLERGKSQMETFPVQGNKIIPLKASSIEK